MTQIQNEIKDIINNIKNEISNSNQTTNIENYIKKLVKIITAEEDINYLFENKSFFDLPLNIIFKFLENFDFSSILNENQIMLENIIKMAKSIFEAHQDEDETFLFFKFLNIENCSLSIKDCLDIISTYQNSSLFKELVSLYKEESLSPDLDYEYELNLKENEIEELKEKSELNPYNYQCFDFSPVTDQPFFYERSIHEAALLCKITSVQYNIEVLQENPNSLYDGLETPLHAACKIGNLPIVIYLIEKAGANINIKNSNDATPLQLACLYSHLPVIKYLVEKQHVNLEEKCQQGATALHWACASGSLPCVKYLIEKAKSDVYALDSFKGTLIHFAACYPKSIPIIEYLMKNYKFDINAQESRGKTPLYYAVLYGLFDVTKYLIEKLGANPNVVDFEGNNLLHIAAYRNFESEFFEYLKSFNIDMNAENKRGHTPETILQNT